MPRGRGVFPGLSLRVPKIPVTVSTRYFFDRGEVMAALTKMEHHALSRGSMLVRRTAVKSIKKMGAAKPQLKIQKDNPGALPSMLLKTKGLRKSTRQALEIRVLELKTRPPSAPGTPPHTHVPSSHMLGFRRNLYNAMDPISMQKPIKSAVVGPSKKGNDWTIPHLHEFGGSKTLHEYVYQPSLAWRKDRLVRWATANETQSGNWIPTGRSRSATYPARPFMLPALQKCLPRIKQLYGGAFNGRRVNGL